MHVAKCHSTISCIMSSCFLITGFKVTVCASTGDNRHNCAHPDGELMECYKLSQKQMSPVGGQWVIEGAVECSKSPILHLFY